MNPRHLDSIVSSAVERYLSSGDFNGLGVLGLDAAAVADLISTRQLDLVRGDIHPNPHIKALPAEPVEAQLRKLKDQGLGHGCINPTPDLLHRIDAGASYVDRRYSQALALGGAQLEHRAFDLRLLEFFRNSSL